MTRSRVAVAGVWRETNVFGPDRATLDRFQEYELLSGSEIRDRHHGVKTVIGGFLDGLRWADVDAVPVFSAGAWLGGPAPASDFGRILARLSDELAAAHSEAPLDAVLLNLHDAMTAENAPNADAEVVRVVRSVVGDHAPIGAVLDLHVNPTSAVADERQVVMCYDTYPHVDMWEWGVEVATLIGQCMRGRKLQTTLMRSPLLTLPSAQSTNDAPMAGIRSRASGAASNVGRVSIAAGFAYMLPERVGLSVLIVHDQGNAAEASNVAEAVVADIDLHADDFEVRRPGVSDAVSTALALTTAKPVVLADLADNVGGGSAGDGTVLLAELLSRDARGVLGIIADPDTAARAHLRGEGAVIACAIGAKFDKIHGRPIETSARITAITDGVHRSAGTYMTGQTFDMGPTAVLDIGDGAAMILVTTRPTPSFHVEQFTHARVDPARAQVIIAKGAIAWRAAYESIAKSVIKVSTPPRRLRDRHSSPPRDGDNVNGMPTPSNTVAVSGNVTVLGAGLMGHGIAQVFAAAGSRVRVWDPSAAALASLRRGVQENLELLISQGVTRPTASDDIIDRIETHDDLASAVAPVGLIFEAASESLVLKRNLLADVDCLNDRVVVASNTSVLRINDIAASNPGARRLIRTHWWNPPYLIPIVEVIPGKETALAIEDAGMEWLGAVGKTAIRLRKDVPGLIGNRLQFALWREAMQLVEDGVCDAQSVDTVARNTFGLRLSSMGPLENVDFIGLDLVQAIMNYVLPDFAINGGAPALVDNAVLQGRPGAKAGEGILSWRSGARSEAQERLLVGILRSLTTREPAG